MITEDKVTEIFCMADDFCKFFDAMTASDRLLLRKRAIIETVNDELKNIVQVEYSRHRCLKNHRQLIRGNCCLLSVPKEAVHQCAKDH